MDDCSLTAIVGQLLADSQPKVIDRQLAKINVGAGQLFVCNALNFCDAYYNIQQHLNWGIYIVQWHTRHDIKIKRNFKQNWDSEKKCFLITYKN